MHTPQDHGQSSMRCNMLDPLPVFTFGHSNIIHSHHYMSKLYNTTNEFYNPWDAWDTAQW